MLLQTQGAMMIKWIKIHYDNYQITQQYIKLGILVKKEEV